MFEAPDEISMGTLCPTVNLPKLVAPHSLFQKPFLRNYNTLCNHLCFVLLSFPCIELKIQTFKETLTYFSHLLVLISHSVIQQTFIWQQCANSRLNAWDIKINVRRFLLWMSLLCSSSLKINLPPFLIIINIVWNIFYLHTHSNNLGCIQSPLC